MLGDMTVHKQPYFLKQTNFKESPFDNLLKKLRPSNINSNEDKLLENQLQAYGESLTFDFKGLLPKSPD